jgi:hypothetical protein
VNQVEGAVSALVRPTDQCRRASREGRNTPGHGKMWPQVPPCHCATAKGRAFDCCRPLSKQTNQNACFGSRIGRVAVMLKSSRVLEYLFPLRAAEDRPGSIPGLLSEYKREERTARVFVCVCVCGGGGGIEVTDYDPLHFNYYHNHLHFNQ